MKSGSVNRAVSLAVALALCYCLISQGCTRAYIRKHSVEYPHPFVFSFKDTVSGSAAQLFECASKWAKGEFTGDIPIYYDSIRQWKWYKTDHSIREAILVSDRQKGVIVAQGYFMHPIPSLIGYGGYEFILYRVTITVFNGLYTVSASGFTHRADTPFDDAGRDYGPLDSDRVGIRFPFGYNKDFYKMKKFAARSIQEKFAELKVAMHQGRPATIPVH